MASASGQFLLNSTKPETFMLTAEQQDALPQESKLALEQVDDLKYFLATAPANWQVDQIIRRYLLPTGEYVSCVLWRNLFHITGTDIVRGLTYRFQAFGRPVRNIKKFEEGIFSDLRNLKNGTDASLEEPKSAFLDLLYKNNCIRTQKKQKVFYWFSVPHDRLFLDALERDLKRERMGTESTTAAVAEPALSFVFDATQSLFEQLTKSLQHNAASEVGASLAAQQAQNNIMAAQYGSLGGGGLGMPFGLGHRSSNAGLPLPTAHYYSRAQSIQSSIPIDYRVPSTGWASLASDLGQPSLAGAGSMFQPGHSHSVSSPVTFHNSFATDNTAQKAAEESEAAFRREYSYDETMGFAMPRGELTNEHAEITASFKDEMPISPTHGPPGEEVPSFDGFSFDAPVEPASMLPSHVQPVPRPSFGMHFNVFEGSPTYKQRRRRQSIPSSVLMQEQAQLQQQQHRRHQPDTSTMSTTTSQHDYTDVTDAEILSSVDQHSEVGGDFNYIQPIDGSNSLGLDEFDYGLHRLQQHTMSGPPGSSGGSSASRPVSRDGSEMDALYAFGRTGSPSGDSTQPYPHARQFPCPKPDCGRGFRRLEHLKRHVRTHTHERPFLCPVCFKKFSRSDNLAQHRRTHERGYPGSGASSPAASIVDVLEAGNACIPMQRAVTLGGALPGFHPNRYFDTPGGGPTSHGMSVEQHQQQFFGNGQMAGIGMYTTAQMQAFQQDQETTEMIRTLSMPNFGGSGACFPEYSQSGYFGRSRYPEAEMGAHEHVDEQAYLPVTPRAIPYHASPRSNVKEIQARGDEDGEATPRLRDVFRSRSAIES